MRTRFIKGKQIIAFFLVFALIINMLPEFAMSVYAADVANTLGNEYFQTTDYSSVPEEYEPIESVEMRRAYSLRTMSIDEDTTEKTQVLLIEDTLPWRTDTNSNLLNALGISFKKVKTTEFLSQDLGNFSVIVFANDQQFSTYNNYSTFREQIEMFAELGGVVVFGACDGGWANGNISSELPGGVTKYRAYVGRNYIVNSEHPIVSGELSDKTALTDSILYGNYCSHVSFNEDTLPEGSNIILRDSNYKAPTLVEFSYGKGKIILSGLTWEHNYVHANAFSKRAMDDLFLYAVSVANIDVNSLPPIAISVDAPKKLEIEGTSYSPNPFEVKAYLKNVSEDEVNNVKVEIVLPAGLTLVKNYDEIIDVGLMQPEEDREVTWKVSASAAVTDVDYQYKVIVTAENDYQKVVTKTLHVPKTERIKALEYTIFSGSNVSDLNLYGWKSNFDGNVYTGRNFNYGGSEFYVNGRIDAVGSVVTNGWKTEITERNEGVEVLGMPDFDGIIHEEAAPFESYDENSVFIQDRNVIDKSIKVDGDVTISGTTFEGDCYIIAEGNITYNVQTFNTTGRVVLYSRNGNITVNGSSIDINGIMYAPNGSVNFNTYETTLNGRIVSDTINFSGSIFNIHGQSDDWGLIGGGIIPVKENVKISADVPQYISANSITNIQINNENNIEGLTYQAIIDGTNLVIEDTIIKMVAPEISGDYVLTINATAPNGGYDSVSYDVIVDTVAPVVNIEASETFAYTGDNEISVKVTADDDYEIQNVDITINGSETEYNQDKVFYISTNEAGKYTIRAEVIDGAGNVSIAEIVVTIVEELYDKEPPTVSLMFDKNVYYSGDSVVITAIADDNIGIDKIDLIYNGNTYIFDESNKLVIENLAVGDNVFEVTAYDTSDNRATFVYTISAIIKDSTPPVITLTGPQETVYVDDVVEIAVVATDDSGISSLVAAVNGETVDVVNGIITYIATKEGVYEVTITATDISGNSQSGYVLFDVIKRDTTAPSITINIPDGDLYVSDDISISVIATDENGIAEITASINGAVVPIIDGVITYIPNEAGNYEVVVTATDIFGNSQSVSSIFDVLDKGTQDTTAPSMDISIICESGIPYVGSSVIIELTAEDDSGKAYVSVNVNGNELNEIDGKFEFVPDVAGVYEILFSSWDDAGNIVKYEYTLIVYEAGEVPEDTYPPTGSLSFNKTSSVVGEEIIVNITASDNSGEVFIEASVNGKSIEVVDDQLRYTPMEEGVYEFVVTFSDAAGNKSVCNQSIVVSSVDVTAPILNVSGIPDAIILGQSIVILAEATDNSGNVNICATVNGTEIDISRGIAEFTPDAVGEYTIEIIAIDDFNNERRFTKTVLVVEADTEDIIAPEMEILSFPTHVTIGEEVTIQFVASDNSGEVFTKVTVNGDEIECVDGIAVFTPEIAGDYNIEISVYDASGNGRTASGVITAIAEDDSTLPTMSITGLTHLMTLGDTSVIEIVAEDDSGSVTVTATINGEPIDIVDGKFEFTPTETGIYKLIIRTEDPTGNYVQKEFDVLVSEQITYEDGNPVITIYANNGSDTASLGENIDVNVTANDPDGIAILTVTVNGEEIDLDEDGNASFKPEEIGRYVISAKAVDSLGNEIRESVKIKVVDIEDNSICDVSIISPTDGGVITSPVDVLGTVSGDGLVYYSLEYCPVGSVEYTEFAYGDDVISNDVLGKFDPTLLENGYYNIRLIAYSSNYSVVDEIVVSVEGQMKIGNYSIAFKDMDIPVAGYPLTVIRSYDSRRKNTSGDFGYGWDMMLSSIKLSESCVPGQYWSQKTASSMFVTKYYFAEDRTHEISIDYGNGQVDKFKMKLSPAEQNLYPINYGISVSYVAQGNTKSKLEAMGSTSGLIYNGGILCYSSTITPYNPSQYKLTRADGTVYIISDTKGVESITDTNGNTITITDSGVTHSDGKSIIFERDSENRITKITGPTGKTIEYSYDARGNLSVVTDEAGEKTTFEYDRNHYLTDIINSNGVKIARNEYDDDGRLIATVDANGNRLEFAHDIEGRRDVVTDRLGNSTLYVYDNRGNVISETDALGNTTLSTYDSNGNLATKTDALGNVTTYNYDSEGNLLSMTDPLGNTVTNTYSEKNQLLSMTSMGVTQFIVDYDEYGNLISTEDAMGNEISYEYDSGKVTSITDEIGTYMKMTYDGDGNVVSAVNGAGETAAFTYDEDGNCASKTITRGSEALTEQYSYDVYGNVTQVIYADGSVTSVEYDSVGNMTAAVDSKGRRTSYEYDLFGNLVKITYCDNTTETFEYDAEGRNTKATDRMGRSVKMTYDAVGNLISKSYPNGSKVTYSYDNKYRLTSVTVANGGVTSYEYDVLDRNTAITDALGNKTKFGYSTSNGQLETMTDPTGNTYTYGYDLNGNRTSVTMPDGTSVSTAYDARGRVTSQTDQYGNVTRYTYDSADRLTSVTDALGSVWKYKYNSVGELVSVTDPMGNTTRYEYDNGGRITKTTNALGYTATATYDEAGNVLTSTDYAGNVTVYTYDELDRVVAKALGGETILYSYTTDGLLASVTDNSGTISYDYDIMNGLTAVTLADGKEIHYTYDDSCRLTSVETPFGTTSYKYDLLDRLVRVVAHDGTATLYKYDANGNRTEVRYANGITVKYVFDEVNRLICEKVLDKDGELVAQYTYTLGAAGERLKVEETEGDSSRTVEYEYDDVYRLVSEKIADESGTTVTSYTYDKNSNRLTKTVGEDVTEYSYNELNQLISETGIEYSYDLNGNLIKKKALAETTTYTYNKRNRLIRVTAQNGADVNVEEYLYDYAGNRTAKIQEFKTTSYLVDTNGALSQVLAEYDENGTLITSYTRADQLISQERDGVKSYYLYDGFDSVRMLADNESVITDTYVYDAFGNLISSTGNTVNDFLYRGEQFDSFTGLYYLRARYMNPSTGTFITMDEYAGSIFEPVSLHKYLYANANPVMYSDPSGYETLKGLMTSMAMQAELAATVGAFYGGILNSLLAVVNGGTQEQIQMAFLEGMATGFIFGGIFGGFGALAAHYWQLQLLMSAVQFMGGYYAFQGATKAALKGNWGESAIYAAMGFGCAFSSAGSANAARQMYANAIAPQYQNSSAQNASQNVKTTTNNSIPSVSKSALPENVQKSYNAYVKAGWKNHSGQTSGTKAGAKFNNKSGALPSTDAAGNLITYKEFDVNNYVPGQNRGVERFVVGSDGSVYYTDSHYGENKSLNGFPDYIKID